MIITIKGADFSSANIGTLSTYIISKSIGSGASFDIPNFVDKNSSVNWVITLNEGYTFGTYSVTMGSEVITPTVVDNVMTITIAEVTGNVRIVVATINENTGEEDIPVVPPVEPDEPEQPDGTLNAGLTLYQGYVDNKIVNDELNTRVKTDMLQGPFRIECNDGYLIRAIWRYPSQNITNGGTSVVNASDNKTSYTFESTAYAYVTFCKTDATAILSPTEDIVKSFTTDVEVETPVNSITVNGIEIKLGQVLGTSLKEGNNTRAYTVTPINEKTSLTTEGTNFTMIPLFDDDDNLSNGSGTFRTLDGNFTTSKTQGSLTYHNTINVSDLISAAPSAKLRVMFKQNDGASINLTELQNSLTIN